AERVAGLQAVLHKQWREAAHVADLVQRDPVVRDTRRARILIADRPADAAHLAASDEVGLPGREVAEAGLAGLVEARAPSGLRIGALLQVLELQLVEDHAVVLHASC